MALWHLEWDDVVEDLDEGLAELAGLLHLLGGPWRLTGQLHLLVAVKGPVHDLPWT